MIDTIFGMKRDAGWNALKGLPKDIKEELIKAVEAMEIPEKKKTPS
jgi:hypothetical protein